MTMFDLPEPVEKPLTPAQEKREAQRFVSQFMYAITAPRLTWPGHEDIWRSMGKKDDVTLRRLAGLKEIFETEMCCELEAMVYLSTASMENPMHGDPFEAYLYLFKRWDPEMAKKIPIGPEHDELKFEAKDFLIRLREWIFRTQLKHMKVPVKPTGVEGKPAAPAPQPQVVQLSYFDQETEVGPDVA